MKYFAALLFFVFIVGCKTYQVTSLEVDNIRISEANLSSEEEIEKLITPFRETKNEKMKEVIGELAVDLTKERPESDIGNWLADMLHSYSEKLYGGKLDFAVQNHGGVRVGTMARGPITVGEIYEVMPFDNNVEILKGDSAQVHRFLNHIAASGGWPVSHSLRFTIEEEMAVDVEINGRPLESNYEYSFALPDYIANGGSNSFFLKDYNRVSTGVPIRDAFIEYLREAQTNGIIQKPVKDDRIKLSSEDM